MNGNNEGTPNPLNPNPAPTRAETPAPAPKPALEAEPLAEVSPEGTVEIETAHEAATNPLDRPMEQAPAATAEPPKKKKTGLIIGILASLLVATGCGVAAILLFVNGNNDDAVTKAMNKLMSGNAPTNMVVDGTISLTPHNNKSTVTNMKIDLKSDLVAGSMINSTVAKLSVETKKNDSITAEVDEIYGTDGDLYFKISGASELLKNPSIFESLLNTDEPVVDCDSISAGEEANCIEAVDEETKTEGAKAEGTTTEVEVVSGESISGEDAAEFSAVAKMFEDQWLRVSVDELTDMTSETVEESNLSCLVDLTSNVNKSSNSIADSYAKNPFIISNNKDLTVASKVNPIYEINFDTEKFTGFMNSLKDSETMSELYNCMGYEYSDANTDSVVETIEELPTLYVEIDSNYNFTRLYFVNDYNDGAATIEVDLGFGYPTNVNISEPVEYKDLTEILQTIFGNMYDLSDDEAKVEARTTE